MNRYPNKSSYLRVIALLTKSRNRGFSLAELIVTFLILGIIAALTAPRFNLNSPTEDSYAQLKNILQATRSRAISTTSAMRIQADPSQSNRLTIEISNTRGCDALTRLSSGVSSGDTVLPVLGNDGFQVGDKIKVGDDDVDNNVVDVALTGDSITLGTQIGSNQAVDSIVELNNNWRPDGAFFEDDLILDKSATLASNVSDWIICFNSRGIASIYDTTLNEQNSIVLTISNSKNSNTRDVTILRGGVIQ